MRVVDLCRWFLAKLPLGLAVAGRKRDLVFGTLDPVLKRKVPRRFDSTLGDISIDANHAPERYLAYAFENIYRHYVRSPLGVYMARFDGGTFVDVGANLGVYSLIAKRRRMRSIAIEPDPSHFEFLRRNEGLFDLLLNFGASDNEGRLPLYYEVRNPGATSLFPGPGSLKSNFDVPVSTLSCLFRGQSSVTLDSIRLIKIDVEGLEASVVRGMVDYLELGYRPDIWCEVRGDRSARNGGSYRDVIAILSEFGYQPYDARRATIAAVGNIDFAECGVVDLLFTIK